MPASDRRPLGSHSEGRSNSRNVTAATQGYMLPGLRGESVSRSAMLLLVLGGFCINARTPRGLEDKWFSTTKGLLDGLAWHKPYL